MVGVGYVLEQLEINRSLLEKKNFINILNAAKHTDLQLYRRLIFASRFCPNIFRDGIYFAIRHLEKPCAMLFDSYDEFYPYAKKADAIIGEHYIEIKPYYAVDLEQVFDYYNL